MTSLLFGQKPVSALSLIISTEHLSKNLKEEPFSEEIIPVTEVGKKELTFNFVLWVSPEDMCEIW